MSSVVTKILAKSLQTGAKVAWEGVREAAPKLFRFAVMADGAIGLGQNIFNANGTHNQNKSKSEIWADTAFSAAELGLSLYAMRSKGARVLLNRTIAGVFALDQARKIYNDLSRPISDEQMAQMRAEQKMFEDCKQEVSASALQSNIATMPFETGRQVAGIAQMATPVKVGGQFFRTGVNLLSTRPNASRFYAERKFGIGAIEPGFRAGYVFNSDDAAVTSNTVGNSLLKGITDTWGNNAFVGNETILSIRPANSRLHSSNGYEREDVHELKFFSGFGVFNHDRTRAMTLEADARLRMPATMSALAQSPRDLATMLGFRDAKPGEDPKLQFSANLRIIGKLTYNPLVMDARGNWHTQTPWEFVKSAFSFGTNKKVVPNFKVTVCGDVVDASTKQGQEKLAQNASSPYGTLLSQQANDLTGNNTAFASVLTLKLPSQMPAVEDFKIGTLTMRKGALEQEGEAQIVYYDRYDHHGERFNTREVLSVKLKGKTYYTLEGISYLINKMAQVNDLPQMQNVSNAYLRNANRDQLEFKKVNGKPMQLIAADHVIDFGAYAQGANCVDDARIEGVFMRDGSTYPRPKQTPAPTSKEFVINTYKKADDKIIIGVK